MSSGARRGGRIHAHQRDTHDCNLLGDDFSVDEMHEELLRTTEKEEINDKLRREYRNRIKHIYIFKGGLSGLLCDWGKKGKG